MVGGYNPGIHYPPRYLETRLQHVWESVCCLSWAFCCLVGVSTWCMEAEGVFASQLSVLLCSLLLKVSEQVCT